MFDKSIIGANILRLRNAALLSQTELAERLHVSHQAVSQWERGETVPDVTLFPEIAAIFGTDINALFSFDAPKPAPQPSAPEFPDVIGDGDQHVERDIYNADVNGSLSLKGNAHGSIRAADSVTVRGNVGGNIDAGDGVSVRGSVDGDITAGDGVNVDGDVNGDIDTGDNVTVGGYVRG
ncbi:MAG: helix-turn-helix domain-containing protein, partial [Clostridia bacterium]|nr:helix-turn-helix domain-containing protein [Clostridia bacterium]